MYVQIIPLHWYRAVFVLLFFLLPFQSLASDVRFHHFYTSDSDEPALTVYLTGLLSESALRPFQETLPGFNPKRRQLNGDERLLVIKHPEPQDALFRFAGLRLFPAGFLSDYLPCDLSSPVDIYFANNASSTDLHSAPYELITLPGPINTRCSQFFNPEAEPTYFSLGSESQPDSMHPDGLFLIEVPAKQKKDDTTGIPGGKTTEDLLKLLSGSGSSFGPKFDFRPGGGGLSNLLDIQVMLKWIPVKDNDNNETRLEDRIVINIVDATGREWQQAYTRDQAEKLLEGVNGGEDLLSRIRELKLTVNAPEIVDLWSICRESTARLVSMLQAVQLVRQSSITDKAEAVPGIVKAMDGGGKAAKSSSGSPDKSSSGSSGKPKSTTASTSASGGASGAGDGNGEDEKKPTDKLPAQCQTSGVTVQTTGVEEKANKYAFEYGDRQYELEVLSKEPVPFDLTSLRCSICLMLCKEASSYCMEHINCWNCLLKAKAYASKGQCPFLCKRVRDEPERMPILDRQIKSLIVHCPGKNDGCQATPAIGDLQSHCTTCLHITDKCTNNGCDFSDIRRLLPEHRKTCGYEKVQCHNRENGCDALLIRKEMPEHQELCQFMLIQCPNSDCPIQVRKYELSPHQNECQYVQVPCTNKECPEQILRKDLEQHELNECQYRKVLCEYCQKEYRYFELDQHYKLCEQRPIVCPLCENTLTYKGFGQHQVDCFKNIPSDDTVIKRLVECNLLHITRESESSKRIEQLEQQLNAASRRKYELDCDVDKLSTSCKQLEGKIEGITREYEAATATLDSLRQTIDFAGVQLTRYYSWYKAEGSEKLKGFSFCLLSSANLDRDVSFELYILGCHLRLRVIHYNRDNYCETNIVGVSLVTNDGYSSRWPVNKILGVGILMPNKTIYKLISQKLTETTPVVEPAPYNFIEALDRAPDEPAPTRVSWIHKEFKYVDGCEINDRIIFALRLE